MLGRGAHSSAYLSLQFLVYSISTDRHARGHAVAHPLVKNIVILGSECGSATFGRPVYRASFARLSQCWSCEVVLRIAKLAVFDGLVDELVRYGARRTESWKLVVGDEVVGLLLQHYHVSAIRLDVVQQLVSERHALCNPELLPGEQLAPSLDFQAIGDIFENCGRRHVEVDVRFNARGGSTRLASLATRAHMLRGAPWRHPDLHIHHSRRQLFTRLGASGLRCAE